MVKRVTNLKDLSVGIGLRSAHYDHIFQSKPQVSWFEALSENYMGLEAEMGGRPLSVLKDIRKDYPVVLHGVSLSIGSTDPLNPKYLERLKNLIEIIEPEWVSDHLCWTGVLGKNTHDLLPLPMTEDVIRHLVERIDFVQNYLKRQILLENVSSYVTFKHSTFPEWEFISEIADRTDCKILLDINNIYVSSRNHGFKCEEFLTGIPVESVAQFHLAGHTDYGDYIIDTHDNYVTEEVWKLYESAIKRFGDVPTLLEWDDKIPVFSELEKEVSKAETIKENVLGHGQYKRNSSITESAMLV